MSHSTDVAIIGSGPAAWAAAAAASPFGLRVTLIAPSPEVIWTNTYGVWVDQVDASVSALTAGAKIWAQTFSVVNVIGDRHQLAGREYGRFDNVRLSSCLRETANAGSLTVRSGHVVAIEHDAKGSIITVSQGTPLRARIVLDGSGATSPFVERDRTASPRAMQNAFGIVAEFDRAPLPDGECTLMDWRGPNRASPSFSYVLPIDGRWLVEETSLAGRPGLGFDDLERRLHDRLRTNDLRIVATHGVERVSFPMDLPLPRRDQRVIGLGAAASLVHPATGYSVAASLRAATRIATTIAERIESDPDLDTVAHHIWRVVWSDERIKARRLESYGLDRVLTMNQRDLRTFFDSFFALGPENAAIYLGGEASSAELAAVMWKVFRHMPVRLQRRLAAGNPLALARSLLR